jgi:cytochrome c biogenesis protein CcmG/thiol:disulfide interchange protein DsbE
MKRSNLFAIMASLALLAGLTSLSGCQGSAQSETPVLAESADLDPGAVVDPGIPRSPDAMPDFVLTDLDGNVVKLSDYTGQAVLLNFWATWCPPCKAELPDLVEIQNEFGGVDFTVVGVSLDQSGPGKVRRFVDQYGINFPVLMGNQKVVVQYGNFRGIPTSFLLNTKHEQVKRYTGLVTKRQLERDLQNVIGGAA